MKQVHRSHTRGISQNKWLNSRHSFNFADYYNPDRTGHGQLLVLNDDIVLPSSGFGLHSHKNMEIISIPLSGSLQHKDNIGNKHTIETGDVQIMSAGTGIKHSEFNPSENVAVNFLQIWVLPNRLDISPRYEQRTYNQKKLRNNFLPIVSPQKSDTDAVSIQQDAIISLSEIDEGMTLSYTTQFKNSYCYFFVLEGEVNIDQESLQERDALALTDITKADLTAITTSKLLCVETV